MSVGVWSGDGSESVVGYLTALLSFKQCVSSRLQIRVLPTVQVLLLVGD